MRARPLWNVLLAPDPIGNFFRPVGRQFHFWWLSHATGESPLAFHLANLLLFLGILALLYLLALRLAGRLPAAVATGFLAIHYAADVPLRWASGAQDLIAVAGALGALLLHLAGRSIGAGAVLALALLSKETVALTPAIAIWMAHERGAPWRAAVRGAWPMFAAVAFVVLLRLSGVARIAGAAGALEWSPLGVAAALAHLLQVAIGLEWAGALRMPVAPPWGPWLLVLAAVALAAWSRPRPVAAGNQAGSPTRARTVQGPTLRTGLVWALVGALPIAAVASTWSAYYYLFALCGAALAIGAVAARMPAPVAVALVALLGWTSQSGRHLEEFSTIEGRWNSQSRINRFYLDRSVRLVSRYLDDLLAQRPTLPSGSSIFFSGVPAFIAWQAADGPLVRWAYRDSSLRSWYLANLTLARARRGPAFFFTATVDSLMETPQVPGLWKHLGVRLLLDGKREGSKAAWTVALRENPEDTETRYWLSFLTLADGDTSAARMLENLGVTLRRGPAPHIQDAYAMFAAGDTTRAWLTCLDGIAAYGLDPGIHALCADIAMSRPGTRAMGYFEAWLAYDMAPQYPINLQRWGGVLATEKRYRRAIEVLDRYLETEGADPQARARIERWVADIRERMPGGERAGEELRKSNRE